MDDPASFHCFSGLSASEIAAMQSGTFGQEFRAVTTPLVHTPAPEIPVYTDRDKVPVVASSAVLTAPRGKVAHTTATSVDLTTAGASQTLRSVVVREGSLSVSVPAFAEQRQPLSSFFDSFKKVIEKEKQPTVEQPVKKKPRLPPSRHSKSKHPYKYQQLQHQQHQPSSQYPSSHSRTSFRRRVSRPFPFTREFVPKIFRTLLKRPDFQLLEPTKPDEVGKDSNPLYCPYHQMSGHMLEDCFIFKEWLEREYKKGSIIIPKEYLVGPPS